MMKFSMSGEKAKPIKTIIEVVSSLTEGTESFIFSEKGIIFRSMEQSGAVFLNFDIEKDYFDEFELDQNLILGINIEDFRKVFSRTLSKDEKVTISHDEDKNRLVVTFKKEKSSTRTYSLSIHTADDSKAEIAEKAKSIPLSCQIHLAPNSFKELLGDVGIAADKSAKHLTITVNSNDSAIFEVNKGSEGMTAKVELSRGEADAPILNIERENDEDIQAVYDMDYLEKLTKLDAIADSVKLELGNNNPLRIIFKLEQIDFTFLMAPLETEDDFDDDND